MAKGDLTVSVMVELGPEFDQLRRDVARWCRDMLPCIDCNDPHVDHDPETGECLRFHYRDPSSTERLPGDTRVVCDCRGWVGSRDAMVVTFGQELADGEGDRPTTILEDHP